MTPGQQRELIGRAVSFYSRCVLDSAEHVERMGISAAPLRAEARDAQDVMKHLGEILQEQNS
jgi:hypothetical protein